MEPRYENDKTQKWQVTKKTIVNKKMFPKKTALRLYSSSFYGKLPHETRTNFFYWSTGNTKLFVFVAWNVLL